MIQRIQTVYLLLALIAMILTSFVFATWTTPDGMDFIAMESRVLLGAWLIAIVAIVISIISFKKRIVQMRINTFNMFFILLMSGVVIADIYPFFDLPENAQLYIGAFLPFAAIFFLSMANRGIRKDENLVRSLDRIR
jgi:glucan phosphoethanolaminetransferase (alkaline phosphatase superfamily)